MFTDLLCFILGFLLCGVVKDVKIKKLEKELINMQDRYIKLANMYKQK